MARVSFVIISHSHELAKGVVDLATQMAPDVHFEIAAGDDTGALGTSMHKVENALDRALAQVHKPGDEECCRGVLLMCDLGSATMVAQTLLELRGDPKDCMCINAPLVESTIAAAVAARGGMGLRQVAAAAYQSVIDMAGRARSELGQITSVSLDANSNVLSSLDASKKFREADMVVTDPAGLHARPAALLVRALASLDVQVWINDVDASSVLEIMSLGVRHGEHVRVRAQGPDCDKALELARDMLEGGTH